MIERNRFINLWNKELGCKRESGICWCDICVKLGFLYDWFMEMIANGIMVHASEEEVLRGTVGEECLPTFMRDKLSNKNWKGEIVNEK